MIAMIHVGAAAAIIIWLSAVTSAVIDLLPL